MVQFELRYTPKGSQHWFWEIRSVGNRKILATSETYYNREDAVEAANLVRFNAGTAQFFDYSAAA